MKGRYGPYLKFANRNYKIPKDIDAEKLDLEKAIELISTAGETKKGRKKS